MKHRHIPFSLLIVTILFCQCKTRSIKPSPADGTVSIEQSSISFGNFQVSLLDSVAASSAIAMDEKDHFFQRVTNTEMAIQMKENRNCPNKRTCVEGYKDFLRNDVESFTATEKETVIAVFKEIEEMILKVNPLLIDREIHLIKTKGNHYGNGVYYTRENKIVIPKDVLKNFNHSGFKETMIHEVFHIFSRYNEGTRDQLYSLIGFSPVNGLIVLPEKLAKRKLLNPDGTTDYKIKLGKDEAYPLLSASMDEYTKSKPRFFDYLDFKLYKLIPGEDGIYEVGEAIPFQEAPEFFAQIKDNTDYIIHPDEVMADNFIYTLTLLADGKKLKDFSPEGMELLNDIAAILKAHK